MLSVNYAHSIMGFFVACMYHGVHHLSDERPCTRFVVPLIGGISWRFVVCVKAMALVRRAIVCWGGELILEHLLMMRWCRCCRQGQWRRCPRREGCWCQRLDIWAVAIVVVVAFGTSRWSLG